ncbi:MAG: hypothetical protein AB4206_03905 [Xenococcaceae cyanobacterium]
MFQSLIQHREKDYDSALRHSDLPIAFLEKIAKNQFLKRMQVQTKDISRR